MRRVRCWRVALAASVVVAAGCSAPGTTVESTPEAVVTSIGVALHDPVWSYRRQSLIALTDDGRVAEVADPSDPGRAVTRQSPPLAAGRNLQISRKDDRHVFVPQPQRGKVAVVDLATLSPTAAIDAGPHPAYLSEDSGMRTLLALSADGTSVTPVDEYGFRQLATAKTRAVRRARSMAPTADATSSTTCTGRRESATTRARRRRPESTGRCRWPSPRRPPIRLR